MCSIAGIYYFCNDATSPEATRLALEKMNQVQVHRGPDDEGIWQSADGRVGFADARLISSLVDGVILVTKQHVTHKSDGRLAKQVLSQIHAPIVGAVLNCVYRHSPNYGYYYNSKYPAPANESNSDE